MLHPAGAADKWAEAVEKRVGTAKARVLAFLTLFWCTGVYVWKHCDYWWVREDWGRGWLFSRNEGGNSSWGGVICLGLPPGGPGPPVMVTKP